MTVRKSHVFQVAGDAQPGAFALEASVWDDEGAEVFDDDEEWDFIVGELELRETGEASYHPVSGARHPYQLWHRTGRATG
jgi:hypothetical protein